MSDEDISIMEPIDAKRGCAGEDRRTTAGYSKAKTDHVTTPTNFSSQLCAMALIKAHSGIKMLVSFSKEVFIAFLLCLEDSKLGYMFDQKLDTLLLTTWHCSYSFLLRITDLTPVLFS